MKFFKTKKNDVKFNKNIKNIISKKNKVIIENQEYDWVIDCTGYTLLKKKLDVIFEPESLFFTKAILKISLDDDGWTFLVNISS